MASKIKECLDTNVILRLMLRDIPEQCLKVQDLLMRANVMYVVDDLAITEAVYVLQKKHSRGDVVEKIQALFRLPYLDVNLALFERALPMYASHPKLSFNDCYLASKAILENTEPLWTFDRALARQARGVKLLD